MLPTTGAGAQALRRRSLAIELVRQTGLCFDLVRYAGQFILKIVGEELLDHR